MLKSIPKHWPRLLSTFDYCPFLQEESTDGESISNESDLYEQNSQKSMQNSFRELKSNKNFGRRKKQNITPEEVKKIYLFLYNLFQFVGFIYILVVLSIRYAKEGAGRLIVATNFSVFCWIKQTKKLNDSAFFLLQIYRLNSWIL